MLPDPEDAPARPAQGPAHQPVARSVPVEFLSPERPVIFGPGAMPGAAVPEAAVHKKRQAQAGEDEIGLAKDRLTPSPAGEAVSAQYFGQRQFRGPVAM